ncbi:MAG: beta-ketoacyl-ACP synthase III, partial [Hyphomonas sp.]|nr:beta-ketoacyl-ACP synthase III [Hyphomonas sp.]
TGLWTPPNSISNEELVASYNAWAENWNLEREADIAAGLIEPKPMSSVEFIEKASGIKARYVMNKTGVLDPDIMAPRIPERPNDQISVMAEMAVKAAREALERAGRRPEDVDAVICAASNMQR